VRRQAQVRGLPLTMIQPVERGREAAAADQLLARRTGGRLGAVVPHSDAIVPLLNALRKRDVVPGRDISLIGLSSDREAEQSDPPYTNISVEPRDVSRRAMETLFWLLDPNSGVKRPSIDLVAPGFTRRTTVMPAPSN
jgi:DNA-binding LacI/PurR family transcriptional regulator